VSATVAAATVAAAATMEAASAMDATCAATEAACAAAESAAISEATASGEAAAAVEATAAIEPATTIEPATAIVPVEPRAGADKDATGKPTGTVVAVRSARVRVISIIAIVAHGGWAVVARTDSNAEHNPLCMCGRYRHQANSTYSQKSQNS
jgi:hypothetical protein